MISDYLDSLVGALSFDRPLSGRVRQEVEDHLREAVAADPAGDGPEAERRAIANFGDPRVIAAEFAMVSLAKQTRRVGAAIILVIAGVFIAMKARVAWYAVTQCAISLTAWPCYRLKSLAWKGLGMGRAGLRHGSPLRGIFMNVLGQAATRPAVQSWRATLELRANWIRTSLFNLDC